MFGKARVPGSKVDVPDVSPGGRCDRTNIAISDGGNGLIPVEI